MSRNCRKLPLFGLKIDIAGPKNPAVIALRWLEKCIYKNIVFTMETAYEYIKEQG